ncbi:RNA polymerase sigma-70 factor (ECF subfamily) [Flavobacteriaceae bacterium MAR_2010_72]|nr:RNA polymerase sigma-70 factor (ECF subfamily) [Flavobacteriaceae bacterium MAR_2010_72]TVZ58140.1 RNA polymerase sigma-70 factor (ECF subfamily) [Flavobacteriaceae bacterium MAR_2010_105]
MPKNLKSSICEDTIFERVYNTYAQDLHDYLYYKYGAHLNPKDKVQDAFVKLWDNCKKVPFDKAKSFLFTVANHMMLNDIKHQKVVFKYNTSYQRYDTQESPEFILEKQQYLEQYKKALESLTEEQRIAFMLSKVEGKKHSEIAALLGVTQKVVEYRIYSAFDKLKTELDYFKIK